MLWNLDLLITRIIRALFQLSLKSKLFLNSRFSFHLPEVWTSLVQFLFINRIIFKLNRINFFKTIQTFGWAWVRGTGVPTTGPMPYTFSRRDVSLNKIRPMAEKDQKKSKSLKFQDLSAWHGDQNSTGLVKKSWIQLYLNLDVTFLFWNKQWFVSTRLKMTFKSFASAVKTYYDSIKIS